MEKEPNLKNEQNRVTGKETGCLVLTGISLVATLAAIEHIGKNEKIMDNIFTYGAPIGLGLFLALLAYGSYATRK